MAEVGEVRPGPIALFGSGETSVAGRRVHEALFRTLNSPPRVVVLETPAGFQPNSAWVAGRLAEFIRERLQNFRPQVTVVPLRRRDGDHSTDDRGLAAPLLTANYIFAGPGSPTYAARHLTDTWAWHAVQVRHRQGAALALASAAAIAASAFALPVYEIYKAGADLHWTPGLDLLGPYGLELAIVTHWDNQEGGANLDTRCGFMGVERMERLMALLPSTTTLVGVDEHTALVLDFAAAQARVMGRGGVTVRRDGKTERFVSGDSLPLERLGPFRLPALGEGVPAEVVEAARAAQQEPGDLPAEVATLIALREEARRARDWGQADSLRARLANLGYVVEDTPAGPRWRRSG